MKEAIYKSAITWKGERCDVLHCDCVDFSDIPAEYVKKAYGVCFKNGQMLIVYHDKWDVWSIPGGTKEDGENISDTLAREIKEESACQLVMSQPIAYQKILHSDGSYYYALLYYCEVDVDGDFEKDIAGTITRIAWIKPEDHSKYLEEKPFRRAVIKSTLEFIESKDRYLLGNTN
jgi:ADP-ribose pyrophosphatase YjhB (NUDIX family)